MCFKTQPTALSQYRYQENREESAGAGSSLFDKMEEFLIFGKMEEFAGRRLDIPFKGDYTTSN